MKLPQLGSTWVDKKSRDKVVVFVSSTALIEYTHPNGNFKSNRSPSYFYRDFREYQEVIDSDFDVTECDISELETAFELIYSEIKRMRVK